MAEKFFYVFFVCTFMFLCKSGYGFIIYGEDDRRDIYTYKGSKFYTLAQSIAAMIKPEKLEYSEDEKIYYFKPTTLKKLNHCQQERFVNQPSLSSCTGFLVGQDLLVTARHCLLSPDCKNAYWAFNFEMLDDKNFKKKLDKKDVYRCIDIIEESKHWDWDKDYALLRLDRPVEGRLPLSVRAKGALRGDEKVFTIGHPLGLPKKITREGSILKNEHKDYFVTNLDTYTGNSGSPIINLKTSRVEGLLVRGMPDLIYHEKLKCFYSRVCSKPLTSNCYGEDVSRISSIQYLQDK